MLRNWIWIGIIELAYLSAQFLIAGSLEEFECDDMYFRCHYSHRCISKSFICDGESDCGEGDFSDEESCHLLSTPVPTPCLKDEFQCTDRLCIPSGWVCDGEHDCADGSDEILGCSSYTCDGFRCKSIGCIPKEWECDGNRDCPDNSDEDHCQQKPLSLDDCNVHDGRYKCADQKKCIKLHDVCNNHADCADGSDEGKSCHLTDACAHKNCSLREKCVNLPEGPICLQLCQEGYKYRNGLCEDVDECETFGKCDQICTNTQGSYNCSCIEGYTYSLEHRICKVDGGEALLLFSSNDQIRGLFLTSKVHYQIADSLPHATAIAYDGMNVYWSTIQDGEETIVKANEHGENRRIIVTSGIGSPEDLAVDWITQTLYFTDPKFKRIGVCSNDGYVCSVIHNKDVDLPRALVLHSSEGLMYWTDWGERPLIGRSGMDGSYPYEFVRRDIHWPNGLSLDLGTQRLFWADAKMMTLECIKLDGTDRRKIRNEAVKHPFSIEVFEDKIFWSDWDNNQIQACNKFTGHDCHVIERERKHKIYGIHIYHPTLLGTKVANPCNYAHCSDLCLLSPKGRSGELHYSCLCPSHKKLSKDNHTCVEDTNLEAIMIASGQNLTRVEHKTFGGFQTETVNIHHLRKIGSITYDPNKDQIILSDLIMKIIVGYDWVKKETETLVEHVGRVIGMDVDYYANNLYWIDEEKKTVEVLNLKNKARRTILRDFGDETPTDIALVLELGYMFVAFRHASGAHIDRFSMDGRLTSRTHVIETELIGPISLFYDSTLGLFWSDRNGGVIMLSDAEGLGRHKFQEMNSAPMDLTTLDTDVFWTTYGSNKLFWSHKFDSNHYTKEFVIDGILETDNIRLIGIHTHELPKKDLCSKTGNCSHLCLLSGNNAVCACPDGMELEFNKETCQPQHICKEEEYKCNSGECIKRTLRCNGRKDCKNGDDEEHCVKSCPHGMFACANGRQCINESDKCNNKPDCDDSSDEHVCDINDHCLSHEFHCGSGECVPNIVKCDAKDDCADASDEEHCEHSVCDGEFRCDSGNCIPLSWECDGQIDCYDGSDEGDKCNKKELCDEFMCENGHCISLKMKCNGEDDCDDMSDERNCPPQPKAVTRNSTGSNSSNPQECPFVCSTDHDICLPLSAKCNGKQDCPGGEDESNCHNCSEEQFVCSTKKCIPKQWVCDNVDDCGDNSDEKDCVNQTIALLGRKHHENVQCDGFRCKDSEICLSVHQLCDTHPDCPDGSDEKGLCGGKGCENAGCNQICHETPEGPRCDCRPGYQIQGDGRNCNDINECEKRSSCSQLCQNTLGSFKCTCHEPDYQLRSDRISCKAKGPEMRYYYATQKEIKYKSQSLQETRLIHRSKVDLNIKGMDIDMKNNTLYWTSEMSGSLTKMSMDSAESEHISNLIRPTSLGYDWITGNVYILENSKEILACNFKVSKCTLVYTSSNEVALEGLIIDPVRRLMFWFETVTYMRHHTKSVLMKSSMAGGEVTKLLNLSNAIIGDIVADPLHKLIYWSDTSEKKIERCTYDGKDRELVVHSQLPPTSLAIFEDYLYWLNGNTNSHSPDHLETVGTLTKYGLYGTAFMKYEQVRLLPRVSFSGIQAVHLFQPSLQPQGKNKCKKFNCKEICLIGSDGPKCLCENGDTVKSGVKCPETDKNKKHFKVSESSRDSEREKGSGWTWFWWIFGLLSLSALGYATYYLYSNVYQPHKLGGNLSVFFPGERQQNEDNEPNVRTCLAPGQHHYENPILDVDQNPSLRFIVGNEIDIN